MEVRGEERGHTPMAGTTARLVADFVISFAQEHGDPVSNLKLQKLLYYAQAWHLAIFDRPLFDERIEAWVHGPAVPPVYGDFKQWTWQPIGIEIAAPDLGHEISDHLNEIMDVYGELSAYQLEKLTHSEDPWRNARGGIPPDGPSNAIIPHEEMKQYYRARLHA
jgi:uncharacterized phage-associated protein